MDGQQTAGRTTRNIMPLTTYIVGSRGIKIIKLLLLHLSLVWHHNLSLNIQRFSQGLQLTIIRFRLASTRNSVANLLFLLKLPLDVLLQPSTVHARGLFGNSFLELLSSTTTLFLSASFFCFPAMFFSYTCPSQQITE